MILPKLLWCDLETTGLDPITGRPLEVGMLVTDSQLNVLDTAHYVLCFNGSDEIQIAQAVLEMHAKNQLWHACRHSTWVPGEVDDHLVEFIKQNFGEERPMLAGRNIAGFDKRWLEEWFVSTHQLLHNRSFDMTSVGIHSIALGCPPAAARPPSKHRSLPDLYDELQELRRLLTRGMSELAAQP